MLKFALLNPNKEVVSIHLDYKKADDARSELISEPDFIEHCVQPIMTLEEWMRESKDFRGFLSGRPATMYLEGGATVYGYVYLIESWDSYQVWSGKRYSEFIVTA
jgi:hypothetical protein